MFRMFEKSGVQFMYPENWVLVDETGDHALIDVAVQSPGSCLWMLQVIDGSTTTEAVAAEVIRSLQESYEDLEVTDVCCEIAGRLGIGYDVNFFCLDFLIQGSVRVFDIGGRIGSVVCQAEHREFRDNERVFEAITTSWLTSQSPSTTLSDD